MPEQYTRSSDTYFAQEPIEQIASAMLERYEDYLKQLENRGRLDIWRRAHRTYYGKDQDGGYRKSSAVTYGGQQGEIVNVQVNHYRSLLRRIHVMTVEQRPAFDISTTNDTPEAMTQQVLAQQLIDFYLDEGGIEAAATSAAERALPYSIAWVYQGWKVNAGDVVAVDELPDPENPEGVRRVPIKAGELEVQAFSPIDVAHDLDARVITPPWVIIRRSVNRFDLAAEYPDLADRILGSDTRPAVLRGLYADVLSKDSDYVFTLTLLHGKTPAVPDGRMTMVVGDVVLFDGPLPYDEVPCYPITAGEEFDEGTGYSDAWDLLGPQAALDSCFSAMATTQDAFGLPILLAAKQQDITVEDLQGLRLTTYVADGQSPPPGPMQMPQIPSSSLQLSEIWERQMETLSGVNSVARGNPSESLKSGAALALVQAQAIQYASGYQRSYANLLRKLANGLISILQRYATEKRVIEITGRDKAPMIREFSAADISHIRGVRAELGNPLMRTVAGKREIADQLLEKFQGKITPEQYLTFLSTGRLEPIYESERGEEHNIRDENDRLSRGLPVQMLAIDNHELHVKEHKCLLNNGEYRYNDAIAKPVLDHIKEHMMQMQGGGGGEAANGPPGMEGVRQGKAANDGPKSEQAQVPGVDPAQLGARLPNMPRSPLEGQKAGGM